MNAQQQGQLNGILGRFGDMLYCDKKYDIALSTAGVSFLNKIVVNKISDAENAI